MTPTEPPDRSPWERLNTSEDAFEDIATVQCPFCFETVQLYVDPATEGTLVEDCEVCCNPWQLTVRRSREGTLEVQVEPL